MVSTSKRTVVPAASVASGRGQACTYKLSRKRLRRLLLVLRIRNATKRPFPLYLEKSIEQTFSLLLVQLNVSKGKNVEWSVLSSIMPTTSFT